MPNKNLEKLIYKSYLKMIQNSEGSRIFNSFFVKDKTRGSEFDVYEDGVLSGAFYVSSVLSIFDLIDKPHSTTATIKSTLENKKEKDWGWKDVKDNKLKPGDVLFWEELEFPDGFKSDQIGFYIDKDTAYSAGSSERQIIKHHPSFGVNADGTLVRKIVAAYRHNFEN